MPNDPVVVPADLPDGLYEAEDDRGRTRRLVIRRHGDRHEISDHETGRNRGTAIHRPPHDSVFWTRSGSQTGQVAEALRRIVADPDGTRQRHYGTCTEPGCGRTTWSKAALADGRGDQHRRQAVS
jgi:hypothetical protein